jgi:DNA-binding FadR family transcriptional regulator
MLGDSEHPAFRRIGPAYEQIANQLREGILSGAMVPGGRLASETELASTFGVSRATVREALRFLAAEGLIFTSQGINGGSFVTEPSVALVSEHLQGALNRLSRASSVTLDEFMELRVFLEVPASGLACERHTPEDIEGLLATIPAESENIDDGARYRHNRDFHSALIDVCRNRLLSLAAEPVFLVLQTNLDRSLLEPSFHQTVADQHRAIANAVILGEGTVAMDLMREHLEWLTPRYQKVWRTPAKKPAESKPAHVSS